MEEVPCDLCGTRDTAPYADENGYHAVQCRRCGLVYVTPRPSEAEMKRLYDGQETKVDIRAHLRRRDVKCAQARHSLRTIAAFQPDGRLLEVGSAAGYLLWEAQKAGYEVQGLDISHAFAEFSRTQLGVPVHEGTLADAPFPDGSFDVVYMRNVLSHLAYPRLEHDRIHRLLRPGGFLIFETGNVAELPASEAGQLELPDHLYHFGEATIRLLLALTGFTVRAVYRYGLLEHLPLTHFFQRQRPSQSPPTPPHPPQGLPPLILPRSSWPRRVEGAIGTWLRYGLGRFLARPGGRCTLVVIAQRP